MISLLPIAVKSEYSVKPAIVTMNHNRILRVLNLLFLSCGYQVQWFSIEARKFQLTLVGFVYFACLATWYAICFHQHFTDSSLFNFLIEVAPVLHQCIRVHLLMGIKIMAFALFQMRHVSRALNILVKSLPNYIPSRWSWNEVISYIWIFSGFLFNFGFAMYIMVQMEFMRPTLQQIMHFTAMFLPHFALACSVKLLNVTTWIVRVELQKLRTRTIEIFNKDSYQKNIQTLKIESNNVNSVELSVIQKQSNGLEISLGPLLLLTDQLELLAQATQGINDVLQKQMMFLFSMNSVCLFGATYSIVNYNTSWHMVLEGPIGRSLIAFNRGVFVFIAWEYICLCVANFCLELEKATFLQEATQILKRKSTFEKDVKSLLKNIKYLLEEKFKMRIFFNSPITWQTFSVVNTLVGLGIAIFMVYHYFREQIENLEIRMDGD